MAFLFYFLLTPIVVVLWYVARLWCRNVFLQQNQEANRYACTWKIERSTFGSFLSTKHHIHRYFYTTQISEPARVWTHDAFELFACKSRLDIYTISLCTYSWTATVQTIQTKSRSQVTILAWDQQAVRTLSWLKAWHGWYFPRKHMGQGYADISQERPSRAIHRWKKIR